MIKRRLSGLAVIIPAIVTIYQMEIHAFLTGRGLTMLDNAWPWIRFTFVVAALGIPLWIMSGVWLDVRELKGRLWPPSIDPQRLDTIELRIRELTFAVESYKNALSGDYLKLAERVSVLEQRKHDTP